MLTQLLLMAAAASTTAHAYDHSRYVSRTTRVSSSCIGSRCALYTNGRRTGSYRYEYGRVTVSDNRGRRLLTITPRR